MKSFILLALILSPLLCLGEDDVIETPLRKALTKLTYADDPLAEVKRPGLSCHDRTRAVNCANMSHDVDQDFSDAKIALNRLRSQVATYYQKKSITGNPWLKEEVRAISSVLHCIYDKFDDLSFECTSNHGGKVGSKTGTTPIELTAYMTKHHQLRPNLITLGPAYFLYAKEKRPAILIHEISHFCGTEDIEYYFASWKPGRINKTPFTMLNREGNFLTGYTYGGSAGSSSKNADNFALWIVNGFCVPQFDCKD